MLNLSDEIKKNLIRGLVILGMTVVSSLVYVAVENYFAKEAHAESHTAAVDGVDDVKQQATSNANAIVAHELVSEGKFQGLEGKLDLLLEVSDPSGRKRARAEEKAQAK